MADERRNPATSGDNGAPVADEQGRPADAARADTTRTTKRRKSGSGDTAKARQDAESGWAANAGRSATSGAVRGAALGALGGAAGAGAAAGSLIGGLKGLFSDDSDHDKG